MTFSKIKNGFLKYKLTIVTAVVISIIQLISMQSDKLIINGKSEQDFNQSTALILKSMASDEAKIFKANLLVIKNKFKASNNNYYIKLFDGKTANELNKQAYLIKKEDLENKLTEVTYEIDYQTRVYNGLINLRKPLEKLKVETPELYLKGSEIAYLLKNNSKKILTTITIKAQLLSKETNLPWVAQTFTVKLNETLKPNEKRDIYLSEYLNKNWQHARLSKDALKLDIEIMNAKTDTNELFVPELGKYNDNYIKNMKSKTKYLKLEINNLVKKHVEDKAFKINFI